MKKEQLRIGNWVSLNGIRLVIETGQMIDDAALYSPILVDESCLKELGFSNEIDVPDDVDFEDDADVLIFFSDDDSISVELEPDSMGIKNKYIVSLYESVIDSTGNIAMQGTHIIEYDNLYVNELQNLVYVLTGKRI